jgi:hypothetical protein
MMSDQRWRFGLWRTTFAHAVLPGADAPPLMLDLAALSVMEPGVWDQVSLVL